MADPTIRIGRYDRVQEDMLKRVIEIPLLTHTDCLLNRSPACCCPPQQNIAS